MYAYRTITMIVRHDFAFANCNCKETSLVEYHATPTSRGKRSASGAKIHPSSNFQKKRKIQTSLSYDNFNIEYLYSNRKSTMFKTTTFKTTIKTLKIENYQEPCSSTSWHLLVLKSTNIYLPFSTSSSSLPFSISSANDNREFPFIFLCLRFFNWSSSSL